MIVEEKISDSLVRHYSDMGVMIRQVETGELYVDAVDAVPCRYVYVETDVKIDSF